MRIGLAADHAGFALKGELASRLRDMGNEVIDFGAAVLAPEDDYPDYVLPLACAVAEGRVNCGIAICGSGAGAAIAANKVAKARAVSVPARNRSFVQTAVEQQGVNVLCVGARRLEMETAWKLVDEFLRALPCRERQTSSSCAAGPCTSN